jgi:acetoin utilization protein AcuB
MIVRHWMHPNPVVIASDLLVSEANRILSEGKVNALPVVDGDRLRGLVTRANLLRMGHFVQRTQNTDEFNYFVTRLRVRDVMVRNPATVQADDTMQQCLLKGQALGVAQFPVLDGGQRDLPAGRPLPRGLGAAQRAHAGAARARPRRAGPHRRRGRGRRRGVAGAVPYRTSGGRLDAQSGRKEGRDPLPCPGGGRRRGGTGSGRVPGARVERGAASRRGGVNRMRSGR